MLTLICFHPIDRRGRLKGASHGLAPPLYYASFSGLSIEVGALLDQGANVNTQGGLCGTALQAASSKGHDKIVEMLLSYGATVRAPSRCYRPDSDALQASSSGGHDKIVEMLLAKGANTDAPSRRYGTALQAASSGGHDKIIEMFLEGQYTHGRRLGDYSNLFTVRTSA